MRNRTNSSSSSSLEWAFNASDVVQSTCRPRPLSARQLLRLRSVVVNIFQSVFNLRGLVKSSPVNVNLMPDPPLGIKISTYINGISAPSKTIYQHINTNINELPENWRTHWHDVGFLDHPNEINWKEAYELPSSKNEGDVQF